MGWFCFDSDIQFLTTGKAWLLLQDHEVVPFQMATNQNQDKAMTPMSHFIVPLPIRQTSDLPKQCYHLENIQKGSEPEGNISNLKHSKGQVRGSISKLSADLQFIMVD